MEGTRILPIHLLDPPDVDAETDLGAWFEAGTPESLHQRYGSEASWRAAKAQVEEHRSNILEGAAALRDTDVPVAFPTETVYGLGADATRSKPVRGIYHAKQRPADNPLIVHVGSLPQLRKLMEPMPGSWGPPQVDGAAVSNGFHDPMPSMYWPLIRAFWPGPLTILLPLPFNSPFAPEVMGSGEMKTIGVRMPASPLARLLISLANRPLAAPSANSSGKPSPTTAQHVYQDLKGKIDIILDGGPCIVGVESTVVDGLSHPPAILRPGGVSIEQIRALGGRWEDISIGYEDHRNGTDDAPRAPGMKYKHYAPDARVYLFEHQKDEEDARKCVGVIEVRSKLERVALDQDNSYGLPEGIHQIGIICTRHWTPFLNLQDIEESVHSHQPDGSLIRRGVRGSTELRSISLGPGLDSVARGLFSALRALDELGCDAILVEGMDEKEGELAAAIMNRLRKAAGGEVR